MFYYYIIQEHITEIAGVSYLLLIFWKLTQLNNFISLRCLFIFWFLIQCASKVWNMMNWNICVPKLFSEIHFLSFVVINYYKWESPIFFDSINSSMPYIRFSEKKNELNEWKTVFLNATNVFINLLKLFLIPDRCSFLLNKN